MATDLIQWTTFWSSNRSWIVRAASQGSQGSFGAPEMLRKNDPRSERAFSIAPATSPRNARYDSRGRRSSYAPYGTPRLYGGEVTTTSTDPSARRRTRPVRQSSRKSSREAPPGATPRKNGTVGGAPARPGLTGSVGRRPSPGPSRPGPRP